MSTNEDDDDIVIYKNVLHNMHDGVIAVSLSGKILTINPAALKILQIHHITPSELIGQSFTVVFSEFLNDSRNDDFNDAILGAIYESSIAHHKEVKYYSKGHCKKLLISSEFLVINKQNPPKKIGMILVVTDITEREQLAHVQSIVGKYIDPRIAKRLMTQPEEELMKANRQVITVSFCDMHNFTTYCEAFPPVLMEKLMNAYFSKLSQPVHKYEGVIDKFIGDSIMSFWGHPFTAKGKHSVMSCQTALDQVANLPELNNTIHEFIEKEYPGLTIDINIAIGIAMGELTIVNVGSNEFKSFTIMGNTVNLAARLVGVNKVYGTSILVTEQVKLSTGSIFEYREIDTIKVKGKEQQTTVYELLGYTGMLNEAQIRLLRVYAQGLQCYRQHNWNEAEKQFELALKVVPDDKASTVMLNRVAHFKVAPPDVAWDGVWVLESK